MRLFEPEALSQSEYFLRYEEFRRQLGISAVIAVSGGAETTIPDMPTNISEEYGRNLEERIRIVVTECLRPLRGYRVAILTGGTNGGVPGITTGVAKELGLRTIFVYPSRAKKWRLPVEPDLDLEIKPLFRQSEWGDESPIFAAILDAVVVIGGGVGTQCECAHVLKINESLKDLERPKLLVPIHGFRGVAEQLHFLCAKEEVRRRCLPDHAIWSGKDAARLILIHTDPVYQEERG